MKKNVLLLLIFVLLGPLVQASEENHAHHHSHNRFEERSDHNGEDKNTNAHYHASSEYEDRHDANKHEYVEENISRIQPELANQLEIGTAFASKQTLHQTITVYGSLATGPEQLSHVRARFEGMVKSVNVSIGDEVKAGDLLAEIESNVSLKNYQMRAPIAGKIVQRHANTGEVTQDQVLFSIANFESLWAELRIYPAQQSFVIKGQSVIVVENNNAGIEAEINHVIPALEKPYQLARVKIKNTGLALSPGLLVEAHIETGSFQASLAIDKNAIQSLGGREGVFVKHDDEYIFTPLVLGRRDEHFVEVLTGLNHGDEYVNKNSYLIKADIEKSEAEHEH